MKMTPRGAEAARSLQKKLAAFFLSLLSRLFEEDIPKFLRRQTHLMVLL